MSKAPGRAPGLVGVLARRRVLVECLDDMVLLGTNHMHAFTHEPLHISEVPDDLDNQPCSWNRLQMDPCNVQYGDERVAVYWE